jgi:hypothetical protein
MPWVNHNEVRGTYWSLWKSDDGKYSNEQVQHALLMDIRSELYKLNNLLSCQNFLGIPRTLKQIAKQTKKRKYVLKAKRRKH